MGSLLGAVCERRIEVQLFYLKEKIPFAKTSPAINLGVMFGMLTECKPDIHYMIRLDSRLEQIRKRYVDRGKIFHWLWIILESSLSWK